MKRYTVETALNKGKLEYIEILEDKKGEYDLYEDAVMEIEAKLEEARKSYESLQNNEGW